MAYNETLAELGIQISTVIKSEFFDKSQNTADFLYLLINADKAS